MLRLASKQRWQPVGDTYINRRHYERLTAVGRKDRAAKLAQDMLGTNPQKLAQEMLGKNRRASAPRAAVGPGPVAGTLASRVGITKVRRPRSSQQARRKI